MENNALNFSQRHGFRPIEKPVQLNDMDKELRIELWNAVYLFVFYPHLTEDFYSSDSKNTHIRLWIHFFKQPLDNFPPHNTGFTIYVKNFIMNGEWNRVYDLFESIDKE